MRHELPCDPYGNRWAILVAVSLGIAILGAIMMHTIGCLI